MRIACNLALKSNKRQRHGAVLVKGGSVLNAAYNRDGYNSFANRFCVSEFGSKLHAEICSVLGIDRNKTTNAMVYVARLGAYDNMVLSRPCDMCLQVLQFVGVKTVIYSINQYRFGKIKL